MHSSMTVAFRASAFALATLGSVAVAEAQSAPSCSYDSNTATLTVTVDGQPATVQVTGNSIRLGNVPCGAASPTTVDTIVVNGGALADSILIVGELAPGQTAEGDDGDEIEIALDLGGGDDGASFRLTDDDDVLLFSATGADLFGDGDDDLTFAGVEAVTVRGRGGSDTLDGSGFAARLVLYGDEGDDSLVGGTADDRLAGGDGADLLAGGAGNDVLEGGPGNDTERGEAGADQFLEGTVSNGSDLLQGGTGIDTASYSSRTAGVNLYLDSSGRADGEVGEGDTIGADVEDAVGGAGNDLIVGSSAANYFRGGVGNDNLRGNGGADSLWGNAGDDTIDGGTGTNILRGNDGNDLLHGNPTGLDDISGGDGDDTIDNLTDGQVELVACGSGNDTTTGGVGEDTFSGCENQL